MALDGMDGFSVQEFKETADQLRSGQDATVRAALSNRFNIILAALDRCVITGGMNARGTFNEPHQPGWYWAKWRIAEDGSSTFGGPEDEWKIVEVETLGVGYDRDPDTLVVSVIGEPKMQNLENFVWGAGPLEMPKAIKIEGERRRVLKLHRDHDVEWLDRRTADGRIQDQLSREGLIIQRSGLRGGALQRFGITPAGVKLLNA